LMILEDEMEGKARYWGKLLKLHGSQAELAEALGESRQLVHSWWKRGFIPERRGMEVERLTGGVVSAAEVLVEADRLKRMGLRSGKS